MQRNYLIFFNGDDYFVRIRSKDQCYTDLFYIDRQSDSS